MPKLDIDNSGIENPPAGGTNPDIRVTDTSRTGIRPTTYPKGPSSNTQEHTNNPPNNPPFVPIQPKTSASRSTRPKGRSARYKPENTTSNYSPTPNPQTNIRVRRRRRKVKFLPFRRALPPDPPLTAQQEPPKGAHSLAQFSDFAKDYPQAEDNLSEPSSSEWEDIDDSEPDPHGENIMRPESPAPNCESQCRVFPGLELSNVTEVELGSTEGRSHHIGDC